MQERKPSEQTEESLLNLYRSQDGDTSWNILRAEVIKETLKRLNSADEGTNELEREVRQELKDEAELVVLNKCKSAYKELLMTGPFTIVNEMDSYGASRDVQMTVQTPTTPGRKKANLA